MPPCDKIVAPFFHVTSVPGRAFALQLSTISLSLATEGLAGVIVRDEICGADQFTNKNSLVPNMIEIK